MGGGGTDLNRWRSLNRTEMGGRDMGGRSEQMEVIE